MVNELLSQYCSSEWCDFVDFHSSIYTFKSKEFIIQIGDETQGLHIIVKGKVKITTHAGENRDRIIRLAADGDLLGHRGFGGDWHYTISAIALEDTEVLFIPLKIFNAVVRANPNFAFFMMMFFAEELRESEKLAYQMPIKNTIAYVLLNSYKVFGFKEGTKELSYSLSKRDIANQSGTRYETVVRVMSDFIKESIISVEGKNIIIEDLLKLEQLVQTFTQ
jgi:CRP-like cAMP-binding protein